MSGQEEDSEISFSDLRAEENNKISTNIVAGYIYTKAKKVFQESFTEIYEDLLSRIAHDYKLELQELREKYPLEVSVTKRKPRDPENSCIAEKKTGGQCTMNKKAGYDYCGIHLKKYLNNEYEQRGETSAVKSTPVVFKNKTGGTYIPKKEKDFPKRLSKDPSEAEPEETELTASLNEVSNDGEVEIEIEEIEGEQFIVCGKNVYYYPPDFDISTMSLDDLTKAGIKTGNKIEWNP